MNSEAFPIIHFVRRLLTDDNWDFISFMKVTTEKFIVFLHNFSQLIPKKYFHTLSYLAVYSENVDSGGRPLDIKTIFNKYLSIFCNTFFVYLAIFLSEKCLFSHSRHSSNSCMYFFFYF